MSKDIKSPVGDQYVLVPKAQFLGAAQQATTSTDADAKSALPKCLGVGKGLRAKGASVGALAFGNKPVRAVLPISVSFTMTSGLVSNSLAVNVTDSVEWPQLAALFDEYRLLGGRLDYTVQSTAGSGPDGMFGICWDPVDNAIPTGVRNIAEHKFHKLVGGSYWGVPANGQRFGESGFLLQGCKPLRFAFSTQHSKALAITATGSVDASPGMWKRLPVAGSNGSPDGWIKVYLSSAGTGTGPGAGGILYLEVELRVRT